MKSNEHENLHGVARYAESYLCAVQPTHTAPTHVSFFFFSRIVLVEPDQSILIYNYILQKVTLYFYSTTTEWI